MNCLFTFISLKKFLPQDLKITLLITSRSFIVLPFTFRSKMPVIWLCYEIYLPPHMDTQLIQHHYFKDLSFPLLCRTTFSQIKSVHTCKSIPGLSILLHGLFVYFGPVAHSLQKLQLCNKSWYTRVNHPTLLQFHIHFRIGLSVWMHLCTHVLTHTRKIHLRFHSIYG